MYKLYRLGDLVNLGSTKLRDVLRLYRTFSTRLFIKMLQRIIEAIHLASRDPAQIAGLARLSEAIIDWDDRQIDQLLQCMTEFGEELRESEPFSSLEEDDEDEDLDELTWPSTLSVSSESVGLDRVFQPIVHHLVVREMRRKLTGHAQRNTNPVTKASKWDEDETIKTGQAKPTVTLTTSSWSDERMQQFEMLYQHTPAFSELRNHLLRWLGTAGGAAQLDLWMELVCNDPPEQRLGLGLAFAPLMHPSFVPTEKFVAGLLANGTVHPQIAPAIFDLMNFYVRTKMFSQHPARDRLSGLVDLLGQLCGQLGRIEEGNFPKDYQARHVNQLVSDAVALIVALCDTFALTGHQPAIPKLHQALQLRHRRVQTESAAALARLNDESGKKALIALAEQPIARLRVLAYAEELGFKQDISLELQGEISIAESQLAIWLSEPDQMGLAPSNLELVDNRTMFWPSYDEPMHCYLFNYSYGSGPNAHSNIGICGPLTHAFAADLRHLPIDEMYAAFAGWQTVHEEIYQMSPVGAQQRFPSEYRQMKACLEDDAFENLKVQSVGNFFGELTLIASAIHEGQAGTLVVDRHDSTWFEEGNPDAPIDWRMAYGIWRGKQLLSRFNSGENG